MSSIELNYSTHSHTKLACKLFFDKLIVVLANVGQSNFFLKKDQAGHIVGSGDRMLTE